MKKYNVKAKKNTTIKTKEDVKKIRDDMEAVKLNAYIIGKERKVEELERENDELQRTINQRESIIRDCIKENNILKKKHKTILIISITMFVSSMLVSSIILGVSPII